MTYISFDAPLHKEQEYIWFRDVIHYGFRNIRPLPVSPEPEPHRTAMIYIPFDAPLHKEQKYIWFRGGDLNSL